MLSFSPYSPLSSDLSPRRCASSHNGVGSLAFLSLVPFPSLAFVSHRTNSMVLAVRLDNAIFFFLQIMIDVPEMRRRLVPQHEGGAPRIVSGK
jgi:hypothetical protein